MGETTFGTFTTDQSLRIRQWDSWLAKASGIPVAQAEGELLQQILPDLEGRGLLARFYDVLATGSVSVLSPRLHRFLIPCAPPPGSQIFSQMQQRVTILPLKANGSIQGVVVTIEDVTLRMEREQALAQQLAQGDKIGRVQAAQELAAIYGDGEISPALFAAMDDPHWQVRGVAAQSMHTDSTDTLALLMDALRSRHRDPGMLNSIIKVLANSQIDVVEPLVNQLQSSTDNDLRVYIALILGEMRNPLATPALLGLLVDPDTNVAYHAIESLGKLRALEATLPLAQLLAAGDFFLGFAALEALGRIADSRSVPIVAAALDDEMMGTAAAEALGHIGHIDGVLPLVVKLNQQPDWAEPVAASLVRIYTQEENFGSGELVRRLVQAGISPETQAFLLTALPSATGDFLRNLILLLGWLEGHGVEEALVDLIQRSEVRQEVIEGLVRQGPQITRMLTRTLSSANLEGCKATVLALGRIGDPSAVAALTTQLGRDDELTIAAAGALAQIGDASAFEPLLQHLRTPSRAVRQALIGAINSLGYPEMATRIEDALTDPDDYLRESAVRIACYFAFPNCFQAVLACCEDRSEAVCEAALEGIVFFDEEPGQIVATLQAGMQRCESRLRAATARGLAGLPSSTAWPLLLAALGDSSLWVRYYAVRSLGHFRVPEATDILIQLLDDEETVPVRIAALDALGEIGGVHSIAALARFVHSPDNDLARAALTALGNQSHPHALAPILDVLNSPHAERRLMAIESLGKWHDERIVPHLAKMTHPTVQNQERLAAIRSLASLPLPSAVMVLIESTKDGGLREAATAALSHIDLDLLPILASGLDHPNPAVQQAVAESLARRRHPLATKALADHLASGDETVQSAVAVALDRGTLAYLVENTPHLLWQG